MHEKHQSFIATIYLLKLASLWIVYIQLLHDKMYTQLAMWTCVKKTVNSLILKKIFKNKKSPD